MHVRPLALIPLALLLALAAGSPGAAQEREFAGTVVSIGGSQLVVEDRRGERVSFVGGSGTAVEGRSGWAAIARGDRVLVRWHLADGPRRADRVIVLGGGR